MTTKEKTQKVKVLRNRFKTMGLELLKVDPWVPITLNDGNEYRLEFSFGAALSVFRETGKNINLMEISNLDILDLEVFPSLLTAGLQTHEPSMTNEKAMSLVNTRMLTYYATCISMALEPIQPDRDEVDELIKELGDTLKEVPDNPLATMDTSSSSGQDVEIVDAPI